MSKNSLSQKQDVLVVGAGASGLMCAIHAARKGLRVLILEKNQKAGMKILVSGGGRCNFTNIQADPKEHYLSENPHFCISAMRRYSPYDFIDMVEAHGIGYHEKTLGQLFCDHSSKQIQQMLLSECDANGVMIKLNTEVTAISRDSDEHFKIQANGQNFYAPKVVIASGGLSLPKIASDLAYKTAEALNIDIVPPRAGLVPLTWNSGDKSFFDELSGISVEAEVRCQNAYARSSNSRETGSADIGFREALLFTHRGLSGPAILQISSYWREGETLLINLLPDINGKEWLLEQRQKSPQQKLTNILKSRLPNRLVDLLLAHWFKDAQNDAQPGLKADIKPGLTADIKIGSLSPPQLEQIAEKLSQWPFKPGGSEGYRTAEVTLGGIDTDELSSKTFEFKKVPDLYAIGEAVDVTGWLGGYNFQWAWASAYSCALHL